MSYIAEMSWMKEHGIVSSYQEYMSLPLDVYQDVLLVMEADQRKRELEARKQRRGNHR